MKKTIARAKIDFHNLSNNRFYQLLNASLAIVDRMQLPQEHLIVESSKGLKNNTHLLFSTMSKEKNLSQRKELDKIRDNDYKYILTMLDAFAISRQDEVQQAANSLLNVFNTFDKDLDLLPFDEETAELDKVMVAWSSEENLKHFTALGLIADLASLQQSIADFNTYNLERKIQQVPNDLPKVSDLRKQIKQDYVMWLNLLESMANLNQDRIYYEVLYKINELIKDQDIYIKFKKSLHQSDEEY